MSSRRKVFWAILAVFSLGLGGQAAAQPIFENNTPVGFSPSDSTTTANFVTDKDVTILVDLNEAANATHPVIANFQKIEKADAFFSTSTTAGYMSQAVEIDDNGVIHRAWVQERGIIDPNTATSTPVFGVVYSKSLNGGQTFSDTVSVSGTLTYDMITPNAAMTSGFSTVDLVVNSKGNPRVVYAMDNSADGQNGDASAAAAAQLGQTGTNQHNSIFFNYSNDGGSTWLPANSSVIINDVVTNSSGFPGRKCAFPRMAITSTDDVFIVYQRDMTGAGHDIMVAKVDEDSLKGGSAQAVRVGPKGNAGSRGGVRITETGAPSEVSPDIAIGDDDVIHVVYYQAVGAEEIEHKTLPATDWSDVSAFGWDQEVDGALVGTFDNDISNVGLDASALPGDQTGISFTADELHLFPTVVVDKARTPDRTYVLWKHTDSVVTTTPAADENIAYNVFNYDGSTGGSATWGSTLFAFPTGAASALYQVNGSGLFQNATRYQVEHNWDFVDRVAAVVDDRVPGSYGDVHIVFSGGPSQKGEALTNPIPPAAAQLGLAGNLYYSRLGACPSNRFRGHGMPYCPSGGRPIIAKCTHPLSMSVVTRTRS